jgi:hypothetical protein
MLMLDSRGRIDMRVWLSLVVGALLLAGCVTGGSSSRPAFERTAGEPSSAVPGRGSASDPDRWAWFCVIGRGVYSILAELQPDRTIRTK